MKRIKKYYKENNYIHYSNCHEDIGLVLSYFKDSYKEVLSVASGLDNSLSFLVYDNIKVHSFDNNPTQIYLGKLKLAAIKYLDYNSCLILMGIKAGDRISIFNSLMPYLDNESYNYFNDRIFLIEKGLSHIGRFEYYFQIFKNKIFPLTTSKKNIEKFSTIDTIEDQRAFYNKKINTKRFKLMFKVFFSEFIMSKTGRDKSFFKYNEDKLSKALKKRVDSGFNNILNKENPYLTYVLRNNFDTVPFYLKEENFNKIKKNIDNIKIELKSFDSMLNQKYDFMNLSDIFEYMNNELMDNYGRKIEECLNDNGRCVFFNMMNKREINLKRINDASDLIRNKAFYYMDFLVYEK